MEQQYELGISPDGSYLYARVFREPLTLKLVLTVALELKDLDSERGARACLLDSRGTTSVTSVADKYDFAYKKMGDVGIPCTVRVALLKDAGDHSPDFMETVMRNAGHVFQIFVDEREAVDWMKAQNPANK
jgi:hypothetical protein